jgi:hypothetical protein
LSKRRIQSTEVMNKIAEEGDIVQEARKEHLAAGDDYRKWLETKQVEVNAQIEAVIERKLEAADAKLKTLTYESIVADMGEDE